MIRLPIGPKYATLEIERRWLVNSSAMELLRAAPSRHIEDRYLVQTRLRLRKVLETGKAPVFKLGKKYGEADGETDENTDEKTGELSRYVVSTYLTEAEFDTLSALPAYVARKVRYAVEGGALDVYETPSAGLTIFEVEFSSEAKAREYVPPSFVSQEVTGVSGYTGYALAKGL